MSTLDVAAEVLREVAPRALKARQIAELAGSRLPTASRTPETVVSRDLALDVKDRGAASRFLRVDRGAFVLKEALPTAFYSDNDPYVAQWTRNLSAAGEIAAGVVDERSIKDLKSADVASYRQFHAFCGIGVWSRALRDAGWPDDVPVWTGSAPCQPISSAGKRRGFADERHLWPEWFRLIRECRPAVLFTEQVASKDGRAWLDAVFDDLEGADYTCQAYDLPACGFGAPHRRQRLYIVAYARERGREILGAPWLHDRGQRRHDIARCRETDRTTGIVSDTERRVCDAWRTRQSHGWTAVELDGHGEVDGAQSSRGRPGELGDPGFDRAWEHRRELPRDEAQHEEWSAHGDHASGAPSATHRPGDRIRIAGDSSWGGAVRGFWAEDVEWIYCRPTPGNEDGCFRPAESGTQPLVDWTTQDLGQTRAARLRGYGNAIVRPQAVTFVEAVIDSFVDEALRLGFIAPREDAVASEGAAA